MQYTIGRKEILSLALCGPTKSKGNTGAKYMQIAEEEIKDPFWWARLQKQGIVILVYLHKDRLSPSRGEENGGI